MVGFVCSTTLNTNFERRISMRREDYIVEKENLSASQVQIEEVSQVEFEEVEEFDIALLQGCPDIDYGI